MLLPSFFYFGRRIKMSYFHECPYCHASLDPGEKCDCGLEQERGQKTEKTVVVPQHRLIKVTRAVGRYISADPGQAAKPSFL